jgi:hypothetical protein
MLHHPYCPVYDLIEAREQLAQSVSCAHTFPSRPDHAQDELFHTVLLESGEPVVAVICFIPSHWTNSIRQVNGDGLIPVHIVRSEIDAD